jgi:hypothetical protein
MTRLMENGKNPSGFPRFTTAAWITLRVTHIPTVPTNHDFYFFKEKQSHHATLLLRTVASDFKKNISSSGV